MPEAIVEKEVCQGCGVDVRDDTLFCYNCGDRVAPESGATTTTALNGDEKRVSDETQAAFDDLAEKIKQSETEKENKLALAAEQRRKARVGRGKPRKIVWVPTGDASQGLIVLLAIAVMIITLVVVLFTVVWK